MKITKLTIKTKSKAYPIYFGNKIIKSTGKLIKQNISGVKKICIISDDKLPRFLLNTLVKSLNSFHLKIYKLPANEKNSVMEVFIEGTEPYSMHDINILDSLGINNNSISGTGGLLDN